MDWNTAAASHVGGRMEQQDRSTVLRDPQGRMLLVVADGMGGHQGGELAAQAVVDAATSVWRQAAPALAPTQLLQQVCLVAQQNIHQINRDRDIFPHSTCVLLYLEHNEAWWTHLGDSRLYHFREQRLLSRTRDHSVVQMLFEMGRIREEDMGTHRDQGRLLKGLSGDEIPELEFGQAQTQPGDIFLLCSDGLWERFHPPEMLTNLRESVRDLQQDVDDMVLTAVHRGGRFGDNVSLVVACRRA